MSEGGGDGSVGRSERSAADRPTVRTSRFWPQAVESYAPLETTEAVFASAREVHGRGVGLVETHGLYCLPTDSDTVGEADPFEMCVVGFRRSPHRWRLPLMMPRKKLVVLSVPSTSGDAPEVGMPIIHYDNRVEVKKTRPGQLVAVPDSCSVMMRGREPVIVPAGTSADGARGGGGGVAAVTTKAVNMQVHMLSIKDEEAFKNNMRLLQEAAGGLSLALTAVPTAGVLIPGFKAALDLAQGTTLFCTAHFEDRLTLCPLSFFVPPADAGAAERPRALGFMPGASTLGG